MTTVIFWTGLGFLSGSIPFSYFLGKLFLSVDIRKYGDGNPGAINAWKAGGWPIGLPSGLLDFLKGALPVGLAHFTYGISGWRLVPIALAAIIGSAFSPFLGFQGGKSLAVTFGVWTGLILWEGPTIFGLILGLFYFLIVEDAWVVVFGMLGFAIYLILRQSNLPTLTVWIGNMLVLAYKHYSELLKGISLRPYIKLHQRRKD